MDFKGWGNHVIAGMSALVVLAIVAIIVGQKSKAVAVINAASATYASALREVVAPITANPTQITTSNGDSAISNPIAGAAQSLGAGSMNGFLKSYGLTFN